MTSYPLYHTLNKKIPTKDLTESQKKSLKTKLGAAEDPHIKEAVIMLIAEHATVNENFDIKTLAQKKGGILPYGMVQTSDDVSLDIEKFPIELRWILFKFLNVSDSKS